MDMSSLHLADGDTEAQSVRYLLTVALLIPGTAETWAQAAWLESMLLTYGCSIQGREAQLWSAFASRKADSVPFWWLSWPMAPTLGTWQGPSINSAMLRSSSPVSLALRKKDETNKSRLSPVCCAQLWPYPLPCRLPSSPFWEPLK